MCCGLVEIWMVINRNFMHLDGKYYRLFVLVVILSLLLGPKAQYH